MKTMKNISKILMAISFTLLCILMGGCGEKGDGALSIQEGILTWEAKKSATHYVVSLNDARITCDETKLDLAEACSYEGDYTVTVSYVTADDKTKEIGSVDIQTENAAKPRIVLKKDSDGNTSFVWASAENVTSYTYDLHDGYGKRLATANDDGEFQVEFDGADESIITVIARGGSEDKLIRLNNEASYHFDGTEIFSMANLANCPFYIATETKLLNELVVGTTLNKGNYDLDITFYLMDSSGRSLSGNGSWGRRITGLTGNHWFCEFAVEGWEGSEGTLPPANETITYTINCNVNKYGETTLNLHSWQANEMLVVADVKYNGKSVMAEGLIEREDEEEVIFDISKLDSYLAVYRGLGIWWDENNSDKFEVEIPTQLADGKYQMEVKYQVMDASGAALEGNGMHQRRLSNTDNGELVWLCEYPVDGFTEGMDMPRPDTTLTATFTAMVENGKFVIRCHNFKTNEILAVSSAKALSGSSARFNLSTLDNYKNVFVSEGLGGNGQPFRVESTKCERGTFELEVSYYAMDPDGYMLSGNGTGGRRIVDEGADEHWLCVTAPNKEHKDAINTVPEPNKPVTKKMIVTLNKKGRFFLDMYDFTKGEIVVIADIKYDGVSILAK